MNLLDMKMEKTERDQTTWNLSEYKINIIGQLMQRATGDFLNGQSHKAFEAWKQIALVIDNRLEEKEQKKLAQLEDDIAKKGVLSKPYTNDRGEYVFYTPKFNSLVMKYAKEVNKYLKNVGLDLKTYDDSDEGAD